MCIFKFEVCKNNSLKLLILDVIGIAAHYNPTLFLSATGQIGSDTIGNLVNAWLTFLPEMKRSNKHMKMAILGLSSFSSLPVSQLPQVLANGFTSVLEQKLNVC